MKLMLLNAYFIFTNSKSTCLPGSFTCNNNVLSSCDLNGGWVSIDCPNSTKCVIKDNKAFCEAEKPTKPENSSKKSEHRDEIKVKVILDKMEDLLSTLEETEDTKDNKRNNLKHDKDDKDNKDNKDNKDKKDNKDNK